MLRIKFQYQSWRDANIKIIASKMIAREGKKGVGAIKGNPFTEESEMECVL